MAGEWTVHPLEDCMAAIIDYRGKTPAKTSWGIPLITAKVVKGGRIATPDEFIAPEDYDAWMRRGMPKTGDVVVTTEAPLGETAQLGDERVALAQRLIVLRGKPDILNNTFLKFLIQSANVQDQLRARSSGTTVLGIKQSELRKISLTLPALNEQLAIAHILGTLDDKIELNRRMNETLEAIARSLFKSWFVDFDPVHAKAQGHDTGLPKAIAELFPDSFEESELGEIPKGWPTGCLLEQATLLSGGTPKTDRVDYWDGTIAWASAKDVSQCGEVFLVSTERTITGRGLDESATQTIPALSTVVVARGATTGRMVLLGREMAMNQTCYALRSTTGAPFALYCRLQEEMHALVHAAHGSVFDTITTKTFSTSRVVLVPPPLLEVFEQRVAPTLQRILKGTVESRALAALRDTLLPKLISGELRVKDVERFVDRVDTVDEVERART
ncbi:MAG: restriction endonuclease subunit S [Deltaproteobacteria bacterium]|nr:restriction endonuclease subunit S [Deltaproteobacteria bacterium]